MSDFLSALEWEQVVDRVQAHALSEPGRAVSAQLAQVENWAQSEAGCSEMQAQTLEVSRIAGKPIYWNGLRDLKDVTDHLETLEKDVVLDLETVREVRNWLDVLDSWSQVPSEEIPGPRIEGAIGNLFDPNFLIRDLDFFLTPTGEISEKASPKLAELRKRVGQVRSQIDARLESLVKDFHGKGVLQDNYSDRRDGRFVLPVKISEQSQVEGVAYGSSVSRQTVFVEPKEIEKLNNELNQCQADIEREIFRILQEISRKLGPYATEIIASIALLAHWDGVRAKAMFSSEFNGKPLVVSANREFVLTQTAHPLLFFSLPEEDVIRNSIEFGEESRVLLLTGPNTGGKTVFLKTIGLAAAFLRAGIFFPGEHEGEVPFFDRFFVDLGDPQSLEKQLSSFSGHVLVMKSMLEQISGKSLVLVDELSTATDPEEGAALSRAFVEEVLEEPGSLMVATTHDPHLKSLSLRNDEILCASMRFDEDARLPTYELQFGIPGRSRALETAQRLGIPEKVIEKARGYLSKEHGAFEEMMSQLESELKRSVLARKDAERVQDEAKKLRDRWLKRAQDSVEDVLGQAKRKVKLAIQSANDEINEVIKKTRESNVIHRTPETSGRLKQTSDRVEQEIFRAVEEEIPELAEEIRKSEALREELSERIEVGSKVSVPKWKSTGIVKSIRGERLKVSLSSGFGSAALSEISVKKKDVQWLENPKPDSEEPRKPKKTTAEFSIEGTGDVVESEIDLRGKRFEEAMTEVEVYLDSAYRAGKPEIVIVHGIGTGAIREGVRKLLARLPYVEEFQDGGTGRGGTGATVVSFSKD